MTCSRITIWIVSHLKHGTKLPCEIISFQKLHRLKQNSSGAAPP